MYPFGKLVSWFDVRYDMGALPVDIDIGIIRATSIASEEKERTIEGSKTEIKRRNGARCENRDVI